MITKICRVCKEEKTSNHLLPRYDRPNTYSNICRACHNQSTKSYYHNNKERRVNYNKAWRESNKEHIKAKSKTYYAENKAYVNLYTKVWRQLNKDKVANYGACRRATKKQAMPSWLSKAQLEEIQSFYNHAKDCELVSGQPYHVDHIVPLKGETVCGLHVPWNLQVLPSDINLSKHNNYNDW